MKRIGVFQAACAAAILVTAVAVVASPARAVDPLAGNVVYYYNYGAEANTTAVNINDQTANNWDAGNFFPEDFVYSGDVPAIGLPGRSFDAAASNHGALTEANPIGHAAISAAGGYTFETWVKRSENTPGATQHLWNPEGTHSLEILPNGTLQFALRGLAAITPAVDPILPIGEWHHVMAVLATQGAPPADPSLDPFIATYTLLIDGVQVGSTLGPVDLNSAFTSLDFSGNPRHGIGHNEFGGGGSHLRGRLAYTRLSLGALDVSESLFVPEPATGMLLGLGLAAIGMVVRRRR